MPEWLTADAAAGVPLAPFTIAVRLVLAAVAGLVVALLTRAAHGRHKSDGGSLFATLVLLTVLIAMVMLVIGNSVARAFGLVGALSIVRFRTVVSDTRDTAFVIFAVVIGMALGAGSVVVVLAGIPVVGVLVILLDRVLPGPSDPGGRYTLLVRVAAGFAPASLTRDAFSRGGVRTHAIVACATARQGTALDVTYVVELADPTSPDALPVLVAELSRVEGVLAVECQQRAAGE